MKNNGIPPLSDFGYVFTNERAAIMYLMNNNVIPKSDQCPKCGLNRFWNPISNEYKLFRCTRSTCRASQGIFKGTFFEKSHIPANELLQISYFWLLNLPLKGLIALTGKDHDTLGHVYQELYCMTADQITSQIEKIGGPNIVVEIDESKFAKRKNGKGHRVGNTWIVGGVERTPERKAFVVAVDDRSAGTMADIIHDHINPHSTINTDAWKSYPPAIFENNEVYDSDFTHEVVNHKNTFVTEDGVHTNTIESNWIGWKRNLTAHQKGADAELYCNSLIWRRNNENDLWHALLKAMKYT